MKHKNDPAVSLFEARNKCTSCYHRFCNEVADTWYPMKRGYLADAFDESPRLATQSLQLLLLLVKIWGNEHGHVLEGLLIFKWNEDNNNHILWLMELNEISYIIN